MTSLQNKLSVAIAAAAITGIVAPGQLLATAPNVVYTATGVFATPPVSGNDLFKLAGNAYTLSVTANAATVPTTHGQQWAKYTKLKMTGSVQSGLLPTPTSISNNATNIQLAFGNPSYDVYGLFTPVVVVGITLQVVATIHMPPGTITTALIHPFTAPVTLTPAIGTMSYSDGTNTTVLGLNGTLSTKLAQVTTGGAASVMLHSAGAQVITGHAGGPQSVHSVSGSPVQLASTTEQVALRFFASGVRDASQVHVQIAGQEVQVLYAGAANHFEGLDEVSVLLPRSLAAMGDADVVLTADGQTAKPVHIQIQ